MANAKVYLNQRRNVQPGEYNSARLNERPIPVLGTSAAVAQNKKPKKPKNRRKVLKKHRKTIVKKGLCRTDHLKQKSVPVKKPVNSLSTDAWHIDTPPLSSETHSDSDAIDEPSESSNDVCIRHTY